MTTIGIVTNPTAASGRGAKWGKQAATELAGLGYSLRDLSRGTWAASYEAAMQHRDDLDALVVVGGDGMVHLGAQVCAEHRLPLGIIAAGSGNDVANTLKLPIYDMASAARRVHDGMNGAVVSVDVGAVRGAGIEHPHSPRYFLAVLSAGLDAAVAAYGASLKYPRGPLKYKVATMRELPRYRPYGVTVTTAQGQIETTCALVAVANTPVFGGGLVLSPQSSMTDGFLELCMAENLSRTEIARLFPKLKDGSHTSHPRVSIVQTTHVEIRQNVGGGTLPVAFADGERVGAEPLTVSIVPAALTVLGVEPR